MKSMRILIILTLLVFFIAGCSLPFGDGKLKISKDGLTVTDEDGEDINIDFNVDEDDGTGGITFTDQDGEEVSIDFNIDEEGEEAEFTISGLGEDEQGSFKIGADLDVPENLPKDIPLPKDLSVHQSLDVPGHVQFSFFTSDEYDKVVDMYHDYFDNNSKFTDVQTISYDSTEEKALQYLAQLEDGSILITIAETNEVENYKTTVSIVYGHE